MLVKYYRWLLCFNLTKTHQGSSDYYILYLFYSVQVRHNPFLLHLEVDWCTFALDIAFHLHTFLYIHHMVPMQNNRHSLQKNYSYNSAL